MKLLTNAKRIIAFVLTLTLLAILPIQIKSIRDAVYLNHFIFFANIQNAATTTTERPIVLTVTASDIFYTFKFKQFANR